MEPEVSLVGYKLRPNEPVVIKDRDDSESVIWTIHITQFALAKDPKPGRNVVSILKSDGSEYVLGTLVKDRCEQFTADFMIRESIKLVSSGNSEVHLTGYLTTTELLSPDEDFADLNEDSAEQRALLTAEDRLAGREFSDDDDTEGTSDEEEPSEEDEEDEDDEAEALRPKLAATKLQTMSRRQERKGLMNGTPAKKAKKPEVDILRKRLQSQAVAKLDNGDTSEEDLAEGEEDSMLDSLSDEGSDDEDEAEAAKFNSDDDSLDESDTPIEAVEAPKTKGGKSTMVTKSKALKRTAEAIQSLEKPGKVKKANAGETAGAAATNAKANDKGTSKALPKDGGFAEWEKAVHALVLKEGPTQLSKIGSSVKKPVGATLKLKKVVTDSKRLTLEANGTVSIVL